MSSADPLEGEQCVHLPDVLQVLSWSHNDRLAVNGKSVTLMIFGVIDDCLWHTAKDKPPELHLRLRFLRKSHQDALAQLSRLAGAGGTVYHLSVLHARRQLMLDSLAPTTGGLEASLSTQTPETVFASLYDSLERIRPPGSRKAAALNLMIAGDVVRMDVGCRRFLRDGAGTFALRFTITRIHWLLGAPRRHLFK